MLNQLAKQIHAANRHWWHDPTTGKKLERNKFELLSLIHSEVSEVLEGERCDLQDDHLPHRKMAEVELADVLIRLLDYAAAYDYDLDGALQEKLTYNKTRTDHQLAARLAPNGKRC